MYMSDECKSCGIGYVGRHRRDECVEFPPSLRADANEDAAGVWRRRAWDMKKRLDAVEGGSAEWVDVIEREVAS